MFSDDMTSEYKLYYIIIIIFKLAVQHIKFIES